jgi:hypothetical protein
MVVRRAEDGSVVTAQPPLTAGGVVGPVMRVYPD